MAKRSCTVRREGFYLSVERTRPINWESGLLLSVVIGTYVPRLDGTMERCAARTTMEPTVHQFRRFCAAGLAMCDEIEKGAK